MAHLPPTKQFLITRKVLLNLLLIFLVFLLLLLTPSQVPCVPVSEDAASPALEEEDGEWAAVAGVAVGAEEVPDMEVKEAKAKEEEEEDEEIPDMEAFEEENLVQEADAASVGTVLEGRRAYDIALSYDAYYLTPKVWLLS